MNLTAEQKKTVLASFLGWTLDAFDFFLLTFLLTDIASEFHTDVPAVSKALFLTLATRFIGAFFFGMLADKYGRKPILMAHRSGEERRLAVPRGRILLIVEALACPGGGADGWL